MSFENLEQAIERERRRTTPVTEKPVIVASVDDIRKILVELDPVHSKSSPEIMLSTVMSELTDDSKQVTYSVTAPSKSRTRREYVIEGMDMIKRHQAANAAINGSLGTTEVNGIVMKPPKLNDGSQGQFWIDPLIKQWFGGYRTDLLICWNIGGYKYQYDVYNHKLARTKLP